MLGRLVNGLLNKTKAPAVSVFGPALLPLLLRADAGIANLECALTASTEPWSRTPKAFHFRAAPAHVSAMTGAGVRAVCCANNHALDFEVQGLKDTLAALDGAGVARAGAGPDLAAARAPAVFSVQPRGGGAAVRVALVAATDNEPDWLAGDAGGGDASFGVNFLSPESADDLAWACAAVRDARARESAALVVFSYHVGPNWILRPPPSVRRFAHAVLAAGADVFHGHSPHVTHGVEVVTDTASGVRKAVVYSAGDAVDDYAKDELYHNEWSFLFTLHLRPLVAPTAAAAFTLGALELAPLLLDVGRTEVIAPASPLFAPTTRRVAALCAELGTTLAVEADGHLWARF